MQIEHTLSARIHCTIFRFEFETVKTQFRVIFLIDQCVFSGKCLCDTGFIGADCSHPINKPPENIVLPEEGLCRQSIRPCAKTNIVGNFLSGTTIYVKVQQYKV